MLKFFNRLERTRNFVLIVFAVIMVLSLVLFYAPHNTQQVNQTRSTETAAKVGGETITLGEIATIVQQYRGMIPAGQVVSSMIPNRIIRLESARLGLTASDAEVAKAIREQNQPTDGSAFDQKIYEQNVTEQYGGVRVYEQAVRDQISGQKLEAFITSGVTVSEDEILNDFKRKNTSFDVSFVPVSSADLAQAYKPTDDELKAYFEQNKKSYYISSPQKKIRYIFVNTTKLGEKLQIPDADLKVEYDKLKPENKQAGVEGQQIVLRVSKPEQDAEVLAKASDIVQQARKNGGKISQEDFAALARGRSEDTRTAPEGGKIPGLIRRSPSNADDPYQKLLALQEGEITDPVKFGSNYYILRRGAAVEKSFEDAKKELEISQRNSRAYKVALDLAQKINDDLKQTKDAQATAQKFAAQANSSASEMIRETGYIKPGDEVENIGISPQFEEGIAPLENQGQVGDKIPIKDGFAIPMLVDVRPPHDATFEEVKDQVADAYKLKKAQDSLEQTAKDIAAGTANASALKTVAESKGLKAQDVKNYALGSPLGQGPSAATSEALEDAVYNMKAGDVTKTPIKVGDSWYVVAVNNRTDANMDDFAKQRDQLKESKLQQKRGQVFSDFLSGIRQQMEKNGDIKVYKDVLKKLDDTAAETEE